MITVAELLDQLSNLETTRENENIDFGLTIEKLIPEEVKEKINEINNKQTVFNEEIDIRISVLREQIEKQVLSDQSSYKGKSLMAVYNKGRVTWDGKKLDGFMIAHPEIEKARKVGDPSVTFRRIKEQ